MSNYFFPIFVELFLNVKNSDILLKRKCSPLKIDCEI